VIEEFEHMITREIDYTLEGRNIDRFKKNMASEKNVVIPKVYWRLSTKRVLTMEYMDGIALDEIDKLKGENVDFKSITDTLGAAYIKQIFIDGFFHADPHQDNIFIMKGNRVCFLDFGAIGYMDDDTRDLVGTFYLALITENTKKAAQSLIQLSGTAESAVNFQRLEWDLRDLLDYNILQRAKVPVDSGANQRIIDVAMKHGVMLPSSFVLFERAMAQVDGVCRALNPGFDIVEIAKKNIMPVLRERYQMKPEPLETLEAAREYRKFMGMLPKKADAVLRKLESGELSVKIDSEPMDNLRRQIRKTGYILALTIILATLMINIAISGKSIDIDPIPVSLSAVSIVVIWIIAVFFIHRRL
jgi:ubiquinone biosynthesis protein